MSKYINIIKTFVEYFSLAYLIYDLFPEDVKNHPFFAEITNSVIFLVLIFLFILLLYSYYSIEENKIDLQYRLKSKPEMLFINLSSLKESSFDTISIFFKKSNDNSEWIKLFSRLQFKQFILIKSPPGIKLKHERIGSNFKSIVTKPDMKILMADLPLRGRNSIDIDINPEMDHSFVGEDYIFITIYIAPCNFLNRFIKFLSHNCTIYVQN